MFNSEFYPTPPQVIDSLLEGLEIAGKVFLEPQGGTGRIVERLQAEGAESVLACELDDDLRKILQTKCAVIGNDFLKVTSEQISHVHAIVMNPPFSNGAEHIVHAFNIAPPGCKIRALCNIDTIKNAYSKTRKELETIIETYGQYQDIGDCFSTAERKTSVVVALIRMEKPGANSSQEFEGFFMGEEVEEKTGPGLMPYNVVRDLVNRYVRAVQIFDQQLETAVQLSEMTAGFYGGDLGFTVTRNQMPISRNEFKKGMQKSGWLFIFSKLNMEKHSTKGLKEDINKFVETQQNIPFTMRNIYKMLEIVIGTQGQRMDKAILEVFDRVTQYHDDNRYGLEGWKTNSHYLLTRRFIMPNLVRMDDGLRSNYDRWNSFEMVEDLVKALCYITGDNYDEKRTLREVLDNPYYLVRPNGERVLTESGKLVCESHEYQLKYTLDRYPGCEIRREDRTWGQWFEWDYFKIRCYKKGTIHFEFKDEKVWGLFNQRVAKLKGYPLAEYKKQTAYQDRQNGRTPPPSPTRAPQKPVILSTIKFKAA